MNWAELNKFASAASEDELKKLLEEELLGKRRAAYLKRLHQTFTTRRADREREEIMAIAVKRPRRTRAQMAALGVAADGG